MRRFIKVINLSITMIILNGYDTAALILASKLKARIHLLRKEKQDPYRGIEILNNKEYELIKKEFGPIGKRIYGIIFDNKMIHKELWLIDINKVMSILEKKINKNKVFEAPFMTMKNGKIFNTLNGEEYNIRADLLINTIPEKTEYIERIELRIDRFIDEYLHIYKYNNNYGFLISINNESLIWSIGEKAKLITRKIALMLNSNTKEKIVRLIPKTRKKQFIQNNKELVFGRAAGLYKNNYESLSLEVMHANILKRIITNKGINKNRLFIYKLFKKWKPIYTYY